MGEEEEEEEEAKAAEAAEATGKKTSMCVCVCLSVCVCDCVGGLYCPTSLMPISTPTCRREEARWPSCRVAGASEASHPLHYHGCEAVCPGVGQTRLGNRLRLDD